MTEKWTTFVMARHGQTGKNALGALLSREDDPLNTIGRGQASKLKNRLSMYTFAQAFSSPLSRAYETAQIVLRDRPISILKSPELIERDFGLLEGSSFEETRQIRQDFLENQPQSWENNTHKIETAAQLEARLLSFLRTTATAYLGMSILLTSHSGLMRFLLHKFGVTYENSRKKAIPNCGYILFKSNGNELRLTGVDSIEEFEWLQTLVKNPHTLPIEHRSVTTR